MSPCSQLSFSSSSRCSLRKRTSRSPEVIVRRVPGAGIQPDAVRDTAGVIHLLYFAGEPAAGDLFYVRSTDDGGSFTPPLRVNSEPASAIATGTIRGGQLAIGRGGRAHVVWNGSGKPGRVPWRLLAEARRCTTIPMSRHDAGPQGDHGVREIAFACAMGMLTGSVVVQ